MDVLQSKEKLQLMENHLGAENIIAMKENLGWKNERFYVPEEV